VLKKGGTQRKALNASAGNMADTNIKDKGFSFHGLKKKVAPPPEAPFDPFDGWSIAPQYYSLQNDYDAGWLTQTKYDVGHLAGGYQWRDFYNRALQEAFGGLAVFIDEEIKARDIPSMDTAVGTEQAATAAVGGKDVQMDDVF
jgi:CDK-activating kinase assembly factor MAT1